LVLIGVMIGSIMATIVVDIIKHPKGDGLVTISHAQRP
jgi:hypothetical protein